MWNYKRVFGVFACLSTLMDPVATCITEPLTIVDATLSSTYEGMSIGDILQFIKENGWKGKMGDVLAGIMTDCAMTMQEVDPFFQITFNESYYISTVNVSTSTECLICGVLENILIEVGDADAWESTKQTCTMVDYTIPWSSMVEVECDGEVYGNSVRLTKLTAGLDEAFSLCGFLVKGYTECVIAPSSTAVVSPTPSSSLLATSTLTTTSSVVMSSSSMPPSTSSAPMSTSTLLPVTSSSPLVSSSSFSLSSSFSSSMVALSPTPSTSSIVMTSSSLHITSSIMIELTSSSSLSLSTTLLQSSTEVLSSTLTPIESTSTLVPISSSSQIMTSSSENLTSSSSQIESTSTMFQSSSLMMMVTTSSSVQLSSSETPIESTSTAEQISSSSSSSSSLVILSSSSLIESMSTSSLYLSSSSVVTSSMPAIASWISSRHSSLISSLSSLSASSTMSTPMLSTSSSLGITSSPIDFISSPSSSLVISSSSSELIVFSTSIVPVWCPCTCEQFQLIADLTNNNKTTEEVEAEVNELLEEMTVDKKATSASERKLITVTDERASAKLVGTIGSAFFVAVFGLVVISDLPIFVRLLLRMHRLIKRQIKKLKKRQQRPNLERQRSDVVNITNLDVE